MKIIKWLDTYIEASICSLLLCIMSMILLIQVVARYVFGNSLVFSEELARYIFIWLIYLGISYATKQFRHIKIESALGLFPSFLRPYVTLVGNILFLLYSVAIVYTGWDMVMRQQSLGSTSPAMALPMWLVFLAPVVGFLFTATRQVQIIVRLDIPKIMRRGNISNTDEGGS